MISVLLPTRGRTELLHRSVSSLWRTAACPTGVQILIASDDDDFYEDHVIPGALNFVYPRFGYHRLHEYYNRLASEADGDWLLLWNDDAVMATSHWDDIFYSQLVDPVSGIAMLDLQSQLSSQGHSCFPAISRGLYSLIGLFSRSVHCDSYWQDICRPLGVDKVVPVHVYHDRYDITGNNNDSTFQESRIGYRTDVYCSSPMQQALEKDRQLIANYILESGE